MNIPLQQPVPLSTNIQMTVKTILAPATVQAVTKQSWDDVENIETEIVTMKELIFD